MTSTMPGTTGRRVLLVGPPGAGKTSQGTRLAELLRVSHVSTGSILREEVRRGSPVGLRAAGYMNAGRLVPDWLVLHALELHLSDALGAGFVLDGYPRTVEQAERFLRSLGSSRLDRVIELATPDDVVVARLTARGVCSACGRVDDCSSATTCAHCRGRLERRLDDDESVIRARLATYHAQTAPMLALFRDAGLLSTVDGDQPVEIVAGDVLELLQGDPAGTLMPAPVVV